MGGIQGINGLPPVPERPNDARDRNRTETTQQGGADGVSVSAEARDRAEAARVVQLTASEPDIRPDRVAAAREAIDRGEYQLENRVAEVARKLSRIL